MRKIRRSVHCGFAAAKQAAQRYAEEVYFHSVLNQDMADNVTEPEHLVATTMKGFWMTMLRAVEDINKLTCSCVASTPSGFLCKWRTLDFLSTWKARECRQFFQYLGPIILQQTLPQPFYFNLRRLALSIHLSAHPKLQNSSAESVRMDSRNFLKE
ncbi:unnamed protein product [Schistosoma mattheei]|uniref:Uncharacterized protein n=1 Tax=Schistosoma mattheei TaxID=31246 RepID=A0A183PRR0_9TREM|nr:unnamed protein product [Schistosoma mattheei]